MRPSSLVGHVVELLGLVESNSSPADDIVKEFFRKRHYLGSKDRRFISDTLFDLLRHYRKARVFAEEASRHIGLPAFSPLALYIAYAVQIRHEERAAIIPAVESNWRIMFPRVEIGAFLDALAGVRVPASVLESPVRHLAFEHSLPGFIVGEWMERFGQEETSRLCEALNQQAPTVIRVNILKCSREQCRARLADEGIESEPTSLSPFGLALRKRVNLASLQSFKEGWFEIQDEGSQLLSLLVEAEPGQIVVDACAGGGGKTLHLAAMMRNEGELYAIDVDEARLTNIRPRLARSGVKIVRLYHAYRERQAIKALVNRADAVLVDAPCSGVGTFRRNPGAKLRVSESFVKQMHETQKGVLDEYSSLVRAGGRLVYSTCTLLRNENEEVVEEFLSRHPGFELISAGEVLARQGISYTGFSPYLLLFPHLTGTDGFFAAVMRRKE